MTILASVNNKTLMPGITAISDVPDTPTIGTATAAGLSASITFTPATTGGSATTYTAISTPGLLTGTSSSSPVTVSGLSDGTSYTFTVRASNSTGSSPVSASSNSIDAISPVDSGYDSLAAITVPSGNLASITFSGIPAGYRHLQLRCIARDTNANSQINSLYISFNGVGGSSYAWHRMEGLGSGSGIAGSITSTGNIWIGPAATNGYNSGIFAAHIIDILDYSNTNKNKTVRHIGGFDTNGTGSEPGEIALTSGLFMSTSAISSLTISIGGQSQVQNSHFALYGVK
jgi:hypothetical protein